VSAPALAYVGLGSNLGDRRALIEEALRRLDADPAVEVWAVSELRETDPVGVTDQPRFLNGVAALRTTLGPRDLLDRLLAIELSLGRDRSVGRWGPRTVDLDLLLHGDAVVDEPGLTVPHPRLAERRFVLEPLDELAPGLVLPDGRRVAELLGQERSGS
jgi:2-amino-4-hydroxy-6-hydroxymethyldihydropteridine diphosphokinase